MKIKKNDHATSNLSALYCEYEKMPSEKLERKIFQLELGAPKGIVLKLLPKKRHAISVLEKLPDNLSAIEVLESFHYLEQNEKALLFHYYLYHSKESYRIAKVIVFLLGQINASSKQSIPSSISENDLAVLKKELSALLSLNSSPTLALMDRVQFFHGFHRAGGLFELQNIHIQWLLSQFSLDIVYCLLEIYFTGLKFNESFEQALDIFKFQNVRNLQLQSKPIFFGFYFQFYLMKAFKSEAWSRRKVFSDSDRERLLKLIDDEVFLKAFDSLKEQKILRQLVDENTHTSHYSKVASENFSAQLDLQVYDLGALKTTDVLLAVSVRLKNMPFGKETPRKVLGAQKILLDENLKHLGNLCHGYSFLQRC